MKENLENYQHLYKTMTYLNNISSLLHNCRLRIIKNSLNPMTIWRWSRNSSIGIILPEINNVFKLYYEALDACENNKEWKKKIQIELGRQIGSTYIETYIMGNLPILDQMDSINRYVI